MAYDTIKSSFRYGYIIGSDEKTSRVTERAKEYSALHFRFTFSIITRYEVLRGLKAKNAVVQLANFERLCNVSQIIPLTDDVVVKAAEIYADLKLRGKLISDADNSDRCLSHGAWAGRHY